MKGLMFSVWPSGEVDWHRKLFLLLIVGSSLMVAFESRVIVGSSCYV